jgi:hypothetical protein
MVALRYDEGPLLFPMHRYHFLFTDLTDADINSDKRRLGLKDFGETIFAMYHHKQARENNYKTPLTDMNLHHPPSGRFGANQVLYAVAAIAVNLYVALTISAMHKKERGIRLTTMRSRYFLIAATVGDRSTADKSTPRHSNLGAKKTLLAMCIRAYQTVVAARRPRPPLRRAKEVVQPT